jgi:hypothetical protein
MAERHTFYTLGPAPCTRKQSIAGAPTSLSSRNSNTWPQSSNVPRTFTPENAWPFCVKIISEGSVLFFPVANNFRFLIRIS